MDRETALSEASSSDAARRAAAGAALAKFVEDPAVQSVLRTLLLDAEDTLVTAETAEALIGRYDLLGATVICLAYATLGTDDDDDSTGDEFLAAWYMSEDQQRFKAIVLGLVQDGEPPVAAAARDMATDFGWLKQRG